MAWKTQPFGLRKAVIGCLLWAVSFHANAEELQYKMELGGNVGTCFYLGDANATPFSHMGMMGGVMMRRLFNPRMALKTNFSIGHLSGSSEGIFIPQNAQSGTPEGGKLTKVDFSRNVLDFGTQFEMNLLGYGMGTGYLQTSRISPYLLSGMGFSLAPGGAETAFAFHLSVGCGVKYKIKPRLNVGLEWSVRFTTSDALDASDKNAAQLIHPYGIKSVGLKNKDCYSFLTAFITYDMFPKYRKCNNE